jgi:hypothetical protein
MTSEQHLEEILIEAHQLRLEKEVFKLASELSRENPRMNPVDLFQMSLNKTKQGFVVGENSNQTVYAN